jgi:glutamate dehydrogenase
MTLRSGDIEAALIDDVCSRVRARLGDDEALKVEEFVRQYYRLVPPEDLIGRGELDVYGAALAHWNFLCRRAPGEAKVRVYNPQFEQHGWQSTHTVVEIVTEDMPFLVDSVSMELGRNGYGIHLVINPVVRVRRDDDGQVVAVLPLGEADDAATAESVMHVEVDRQPEGSELEALRSDLLRVLGAVRASVEDWPQMRARVRELIAELDTSRPPVESSEIEEAKALLEWLDEGHFTFLGFREYELLTQRGEDQLRAIEGSGLGILRQASGKRVSRGFERLPARVRELARTPSLLNLTKANSRATVHRPSYLDYVSVKRFDESGTVVGERRFLGLYTSAAYKATAREIPVVRRKIDAVMARTAFPPGGHNEKALVEILETYPRDELFQIPEDELFEIATGILGLGERQRVRLFVRRDEYERFLSCLVFMPRDRFNTENRERVQEILRAAFDAESVDFELRLSESVLVRIHYVVRTRPGELPDYDVDEIEDRIVAATRSWKDDLYDALIEEHGEADGNALFRRYGEAFPTAYCADWVARSAVADIARLEALRVGDGLELSLYRPLEAPTGIVRCKLFRSDAPLSLSAVLPMFENMGLSVNDERPYEVRPSDGSASWVYDFGLDYVADGALAIDDVGEGFHEAFARVWRGEAENDGLNGLVLRAHLAWREITVLRAIARYLRQAGTTFSDRYMERALLAHPDVARKLVDLFVARFDPARERNDAEAEAAARAIEDVIDSVESLDEDRILRSFLAVVRAMLRTNYFQPDADGAPKQYVSCKLDPSRIPLVPHPRPQFEIFVYSPWAEGVHLRGGKVARGGLRWSDRREDFRTEILGLVKAQMVKNAVIVPVGAKGGFVVKRPPAEREALLGEVVRCYRTFICGLLDITDNIVDGSVHRREHVVRYDEDDPYLVVAADKGTATFSDLANGIAAEYDFWLGDGFASGGSVGYDHKKMGITARGAWESVKRHFRELGTDTQTTDFTVVGVGDMSGDVFGNGMLLSEHVKLVAAFDHRHVFIDPDPDPAVSFAERKRMFELPRSSWADYDASLISEGGGVWPRTAKSIQLSPQAQQALGIEADSMTPTELIRAALQAPVDLLWNGGIGTYVKAKTETHADAGDKTNDAVRVDAGQLRCKVVGEGGNLGLTQAARIEFALNGGRINTDAIDNAAGVNCSDHEVNIKILLDSIVADGDITMKQRNKLLAQMTDAVAGLVLRDNYTQTLALSLARAQAPGMLDVHDRFMRGLEQDGKINRALEGLPDAEAIAERATARIGLVQPELAVLLAYSKITLYAALLDSDLPEDPYLSRDLARYFPSPLPSRFTEQMERHHLRREIIATHVTNNMVDRAGSTFAFRMAEDTGASASDIARAYAIAREVFDMTQFWDDVDALDNRVDAETQLRMLLEARKLVERATRWLLRNRRRPLDIAREVDRFATGAGALSDALPEILVDAERGEWDAAVESLVSEGVPEPLAERIARLQALFAALDVVEVAGQTARPVDDVGALHFLIGGRLHLHWLSDRIAELPRSNRWEAMARAALRDDLFSLHADLTLDVLSEARPDGDPGTRLDDWMAANAHPVERCMGILSDIRTTATHDLTTLPVALREVRNLIQSTTPVAGNGAASASAAAAAVTVAVGVTEEPPLGQ